MARIAQEELEQLKRDTDLVALVQSRGIKLTKHGGRDLKCLCPFHDDNNPSMIISPHKNLWNCPACGKGGDVIKFVELYDGVSFRHAVELLKNGRVLASGEPVKRSTVPKLDAPVEFDADDHEQLGKVIDYYHERLLETTPAKEYLEKRGLFNLEAVKTFRLGYADRTLGLRLPDKRRKTGLQLRSQLEKLGIYRPSGHEHFNGCLVMPIIGPDGAVTEVYGRKLSDTNRHRGSPSHLYLPGPHRGVWNSAGLEGEEVILCEALLDALTFWVHGFGNVTSAYGTGGLTEDIVKTMVANRVKHVRIAYDNDQAGNRAAAVAAEKLGALGIDTFRVMLPLNMDVNAFALSHGENAASALKHALSAAEWCQGATVAKGAAAPNRAPADNNNFLAANSLAAKQESLDSSSAAESAQVCAPEQPCSLAANEAKLASDEPKVEQVGQYCFLRLGKREYRVGGLAKNNSLEVMRVALRLRYGERFHLDSLDLTQDNQRRRFIERAAEETTIERELVKRDLGKLLFALEDVQLARLNQGLENDVEQEELMSEEERVEALALLKRPDLLERIGVIFDECGLVGETINRLAAYLACTSRKLDRPLAVIIQSTSAAGKSTLMEAVLAMFPEEERVKYSAMTGQSLYYLGETDLKHKILAIVEEEGAEKASYALKLLQSEGELTIASTGKDTKSGRMETQVYRLEGPVMIFLTTTAVEIDEELLNRCLVLTVDESREQTEKIHALQRQARTLAGLHRRKHGVKLRRLLANVQRLLEPIDVVNPYAEQLTFTAGRTRTRRDHEKYLTLIDAVALLHQHQRKKETLDGEDVPFIHVTLADIALVNQFAPELLGRSLDELSPQTRRLLNEVKQLVSERAEAENIEPRHVLFSRREIRLRLGWSVTQTRVHLERLREHEYIALHYGRTGCGFQYELAVTSDEADGSCRIGLIEVDKLQLQREPDGKNANLTPR